jgi:hypothetical protein
MKLDTRALLACSPKWIWDETLDYAKDCKVLFHDVHLPFYVCSIGAHIVNLCNKAKWFFGRTGETADLRLHTLIIAPPGFSKSLFQNFLFNPHSGIIGAQSLPSRDVSASTEASLVGSFEGKGKRIVGIAEACANGFLYTDELSSVLNQVATTHSKNILDALLSILDRGFVNKSLRMGNISYETNCTAIFGTQHERLDVRSGLDRRLFILDCTPNSKDRARYFDAFVEGTGITPDMKRVAALRKSFSFLFENFDIDELSVDPALYDLCKKLGMAHTDVIMFERLAVGYSVFNNWEFGEPLLKVALDDELWSMVERAWKWRKVFREEGLQIIKLVDERDWGLTELKNYLARSPHSLQWDVSGYRIDRLVEKEFLKKEKRPTQGSKKETVFLTKGEQWPY